MKSLQELFKNKETATKEFLKHPRFKYLEEIYKLVNTQRKAEGFRALPIRVYAVKTAHLSLEDLDFLVKRMRASLSPGKVFFGSLKIK